MIRNWFSTRGAIKTAVALADQIAPLTVAPAVMNGKRKGDERHDRLLEIIQRADRELRSLELNFFKKVKFANTFKWRLLDQGVEKHIADSLTQRLVVIMSSNRDSSRTGDDPAASLPLQEPRQPKSRDLLAQGDKCIARGAFQEAIGFYEAFIKLVPGNASALNNLGAALCKVGRYKQAENFFRRAIRMDPDLPDAHGNLGTVLRGIGSFAEAETSLKKALKLNPRYIEARINLGLTLALLGRTRDAEAQFAKVRKVEPHNPGALFGLGFIAKVEGRFSDARDTFERILATSPNMPSALACVASTGKMTDSDGPWLARAEALAAAGILPLDEAELRFAIGKYYDDVKKYKLAFENYKRANELLKPIADIYDRKGQTRHIDALVALYNGKSPAEICSGARASLKPVFVVGMPRSGTSLTEQIISSHPLAKGAGELEFWNEAAREHHAPKWFPLSESTKNNLAEGYLRALTARSGDADRIVDKTPINSDHLGMIRSVFPNARIIYMKRDPIDTCLSCYFQKFALSLNYTMDLSDLAHYYLEHDRLMAHWRSIFPPGTILDVPYAELVANQEEWTRKILHFLGLEWDARCLDFYVTKRPVATASSWQVRQRIYRSSINRWRNYAKFIGPIMSLNKAAR